MSPKISSLILAQIEATGLFVPDLVKYTYKIVHSALCPTMGIVYGPKIYNFFCMGLLNDKIEYKSTLCV